MSADDVQVLTQEPFAPDDFKRAEDMARRLGYTQYPYTSTSALWGLFCLPENPATWRGPARALQHGAIIKTRELGLLFVQSAEDLGFEDLHRAELRAAERKRKQKT